MSTSNEQKHFDFMTVSSLNPYPIYDLPYKDKIREIMEKNGTIDKEVLVIVSMLEQENQRLKQEIERLRYQKENAYITW